MATDLKAISRAFYEQIDGDGAQSIPPMLSEDFVAHIAGMPPMNRDAFQGFGRAFYAAFPGLRHSVDQQVAEGDTVVNRLTARGTHTDSFQGIPATGRTVAIPAIAIHHFKGEQIVEQFLLFDAMGMMQQLGVIPDPNAASA